jgi:hypothetical protein
MLTMTMANGDDHDYYHDEGTSCPTGSATKKDDESDESMHFMHFTNTQFSIIQLQRSLLM